MTDCPDFKSQKELDTYWLQHSSRILRKTKHNEEKYRLFLESGDFRAICSLAKSQLDLWKKLYYLQTLIKLCSQTSGLKVPPNLFTFTTS